MSAVAPNGIWAYDFVFDTCVNGQKLECLTAVEEYIRESLRIDVGARIRSGRVIEVQEHLVTPHGAPAFLRSDNGLECVAKTVQGWLKQRGIETTYIEPGRPWQNGAAESFDSKFATSASTWSGSTIDARPPCSSRTGGSLNSHKGCAS